MVVESDSEEPPPAVFYTKPTGVMQSVALWRGTCGAGPFDILCAFVSFPYARATKGFAHAR